MSSDDTPVAPPHHSTTAPADPEDLRLPDNAFRELAPGERYEPVRPAS